MLHQTMGAQDEMSPTAILRRALLAYAATTLGQERATCERLAAEAEMLLGDSEVCNTQIVRWCNRQSAAIPECDRCDGMCDVAH